MPTVPVYLKDATYSKLQRLSSQEDESIGKLVQLIVEAYFFACEREMKAHGETTVQPRG